jgi:hypothetical protein
MKRILFLLLIPFLLLGCANPEYIKYLDVQSKIESDRANSVSAEATAKHNADAEKYKAMAAIAAGGDQTAKVAAVMAIALGQASAPQTPQEPRATLQAPPINQALQWASVLVPSLTNMVGMNYAFRTSEVQSNNAREVSVSTNGAFTSMGTNIKDTAASGFTASHGIAVSGFNSIATVASLIQAPTTITGDAVIGSGVLTKTDSHNTTTTDNHTTNPPVVIPAGKVCSVSAAGVITCL